MTKEIDELKKCIKDKDRRIKKLENYFYFRNHMILSILGLLLVWSPLICMFLLVEPVPIDFIMPLVPLIFMVIGVIAFLVGEIVLSFYAMSIIWKEF